MKLERYDKDVYRIIGRGCVIGFACRLSNGKWSPYDVDDTRLSRELFDKPSLVRDWFALRDAKGERGE